MKRPFFVIGSTMLLTLFLLNGSNIKVMSVAFVAALIAFFISMLHKGSRKDKTLPTAFFCMACSVLLLFSAQTKIQQKAEKIKTDTLTIEAHLCDLPYRQNHQYYYPLQTDQINGRTAKENIRLVSQEPLDLKAKEVLYANLDCFTLGTFSENEKIEMHYRAKGMYMGGRIQGDFTIKPSDTPPITSYILALRMHLLDVLKENIPEKESGVMAAMTLGTSSLLDIETKQNFRVAGVSHLLVVSGLHFTTLAGFLLLGLQKLHMQRRKRAALGLVFTAFLAVFMGATPSVLRAAFLFGMVFAADLFRREAESYNSVGLSLCVMLLVNPFAARSLSLLLSTFATLGILTLTKPMQKRFLRPFQKYKRHKIFYALIDFCTSVLSVTTGVTVFTLPIQILEIGTFSVYALLGNFLLVFPSGFLMIFTVLGTLLSALSLPALSLTFYAPAVFLTNYFLWTTEKISHLPFATLPLAKSISELLLAIFFFLLAIVFFLKISKEKILKILSFSCAVLLIVANLGAFFYQENTLSIFPIASKSGLSVILKTHHQNILICDSSDAYADREICDILYKTGASQIDALILPTEREKAYKEAKEVSLLFPIKTVYALPKAEKELLTFSKEIKTYHREVLSFQGDLTLLLSDAGYVEVLFGKSKCRLAFANNIDFKGSGATLYLSAEEIASYGFSEKEYGAVILGGKEQNADFLAMQGVNVYTLSENPNLEIILSAEENSYRIIRR